MALEKGLVENEDFGMINNACLTELTPEWYDENGKGDALLVSSSNRFPTKRPIPSAKSISCIRGRVW